jgi:hypothetical protein
MYLEVSEMKSVLYEYQMAEIAEGDTDIICDGIDAAIAEVRGYFEAANSRINTAQINTQQATKWKLYDTGAIFSATGPDRNAFVLRLVKRVAAWNICELSNVDAIYEHVRERYESAITTLEKIAGMAQYAHSPLTLSDLPSPSDATLPISNNPTPPFRSGSRQKFIHE